MSASEQRDTRTEETLAQLRKDADHAKLIGTITGIGTIVASVGAGLVLPAATGAVTAAIAGAVGAGLTVFMLGRKTSDEKQIRQIQERSQQAQGPA